MKKSLCLLMTALLMSSLLISCQSGDALDEVSETTTLQAEETTTEGFDNGLPDTDLDGYEISFIGKGESFGAFEVYDVFVEEETGDILLDAIYKRNKTIENKYNFTIKFSTTEGTVYKGGNRPADAVRTMVLANDNTYDVIYDGMTQLSPLAQEKLLYDLHMLPNLNLSQPWWHKNTAENLSIAGKLFYTSGDHMLGPYDGLYCILFNKKLVEDYGMGNLYDYVDNDTWTCDAFSNLIRDAASDLNGDGVIGKGDLLPYFTESYSFYTFMVGCGAFTSAKDSDDLPYIIADSERNLKAIDEVLKIFSQTESVHFIENVIDSEGSENASAYYINGFINNEFIFREGSMMEIPKLRGMDTDFGIMPMPKLDESQDEYYHTFSVWNAAMMSVPINVEAPDKIGFIIEAMAAESYNSVMPTYIEQQLNTKLLRDNDSEKIVKLIFDSMTIDLIDSYSWAPLVRMYQPIAKSGSNTFASTYASSETAFLNNVDEIINIFTAE